jgi:hypothetical protein
LVIARKLQEKPTTSHQMIETANQLKKLANQTNGILQVKEAKPYQTNGRIT